MNRSQSLKLLQVQALIVAAAMHEQAVQKAKETEPIVRDWGCDRNKKNAGMHECNKCGFAFFSKLCRKYCHHCQQTVTANLASLEKAQQEQTPWGRSTRQDRRSGLGY